MILLQSAQLVSTTPNELNLTISLHFFCTALSAHFREIYNYRDPGYSLSGKVLSRINEGDTPRVKRALRMAEGYSRITEVYSRIAEGHSRMITSHSRMSEGNAFIKKEHSPKATVDYRPVEVRQKPNKTRYYINMSSRLLERGKSYSRNFKPIIIWQHQLLMAE